MHFVKQPANRIQLLAPLFLCLLSSQVYAQNFGEMIRSSEPLTPEEELKSFTVPAGFKVQLFAAEPDIQKPLNMAFDARGRMWVSGSNDYPLPDFTENATDSIRILEDTNGDGRADKFTTFVEGITIPMGIYPYQDGVIAFAIPNITFYRDTNGDGKSDTTEILYGPFDHTRDTHGLNNAFRRGLDGWIYACHGFNNNSKVAGTDGHSISMQSGNTYRFKLDGSRIEHHTHGQVNPFGMTFDSWGDLYSSDCHTVPVTLLLRDGFYPSFGKPHDGLGFVPAVMTHLHGSTAIAGLSQYTGNAFPAEYQNSLFVGNVMTCRVHRDVIEYIDSTAKVVEQPDFLTSSDSWFRPVDIQCSPDQALYVADFYNRIIGHYEVPLDHPGRDRYRGRIWKVTYAGNSDSKTISPDRDLTQLSTEKLIESLSSSNLPRCYQIVEQLVERGNAATVSAIRTGIQSSKSPAQQAYLLWVLHQLDAVTIDDLRQAFDLNQPVLQVHVLRILGEQSNWTNEQKQLATDGLNASPLVARAAAMSLAKQPAAKNIAAILAKQESTPAADVHLRHALKIALRNSLQMEGAYDLIVSQKLSDADHTHLVDASLAVKSEASAKYLLSRIEVVRFEKSQLKEIVTLAARHLRIDDLPKLISISRTQFSAEVDLQTEVLRSILAGLEQQGREPTQEVAQWGEELVRSIFQSKETGFDDWESIGINGQPPIAWDIEPRSTADGKQDLPFLSSLPAGEKATGILKSRPFRLPKSLSFYICGHLGFPKDEPLPQGFVSLHLVGEEKPIKIALAPRSDLAQKVSWDLSAYTGKAGYLQVTDDLGIKSYAWLAVHGIDPPVVKLPTLSPKVINSRLEAAIVIVSQLEMSQYRSQCEEIALSTKNSNTLRFEALRYLSKLVPNPLAVGLLTLYREESISQSQREQIARLIIKKNNDEMKALLKTLPLSNQTIFARSLTNFRQGAERLLSLINAGIISASVLQSPAVVSQIEDLSDATLKAKLLAISASLPDANVQLNQLLKERRLLFRNDQYSAETGSAETGKVIFQKNCAACHSLAGVGKKIGPQLDGIGNRGLDRLLEDILAPNRNIDLAFRSHTYLLANGKVQSGLFRREAGELTVIANQKGEEVSFPTQSIDAEKVSAVSIMPENWSESIPPTDFNHLIAYLLEQRQKVASPE